MKQLMSTAALAALFLASCQESDLGSGANTIDREYAKSASDVWTAALKSAEAADLKVKSDRHDKMGGEIIACRANGREVSVNVKSLDENTSRVSVRVEPGDRDLANMLQERIAERIGLGAAKSGLFGGNSLEASYRVDLPGSMTSAHRTFMALRVTTTGEETHASWARLDGRLKDSTPVRIRMEKVEEQKTQVTFIAGNTKSDDNKEFAQKMKDEFEKTTSSGGGGK